MEKRLALGEWSFRSRFWREPWYGGVRPDPLGESLVVAVRAGMMKAFARSVSSTHWRGCLLAARELDHPPAAPALHAWATT